MSAQVVFSAFSAVFAVLAAFAWIRSTVVWVPSKNPGSGLLLTGDVSSKDDKGRYFLVAETMKLQSRWNRIAAWLAAAAAIAQAFSVFPWDKVAYAASNHAA